MVINVKNKNCHKKNCDKVASCNYKNEKYGL